ncbi:hypothetical protein NP493_37g05032 [Ridgeia piscesae]|uniref:Uncharacterized protein n=1 Tax=Ridgeia piscesae TaxID=27915 RepID=A0AAD9PCI2_RIDPI|nr:hypothetical protein NP493_37g05032 [Ridgeia piscesae]
MVPNRDHSLKPIGGVMEAIASFTARIATAKFEGPLGRPLVLTSEVHIIPNTLPYPRCHGEGCYETLV